MPTNLENLNTRKAAITAELAALTSAGAGGKPNSSGGGDNVDHVGYKDGLYRELTEINKLLSALEGPVEESMRGWT